MRKQLVKLWTCIGLLLPLLGGCSEGEREDGGYPVEQTNELQVNWSVLGSEQVQTYAVTVYPHEVAIHDIYTLFFRSGTHGTSPDEYVGFTRSGINSSGTTTGSSMVGLPAGESVTDEWQLIFLANLDQYADLDGEPDVTTWLNTHLAGKTIIQARPLLTGIAAAPTGIQSYLPMSGELTKPVNTQIANVTLTRRVARIDVVNSATGNFILESAQIWNARTKAYLMNDGSVMGGTAGADFVHYDNQVITTNSGTIEGALYAFPNYVTTPFPNDKHTTCLIIGGRYNNSATVSYYRLNVCPSGFAQDLKGNGAYTINIRTVNTGGKPDPGDAHNEEDVALDYTITEWDDSFNATYIYDANGNGLAVSRRFVTFSEEGNQEVNLEVFRIENPASPITGDWSVGTVSGTNAIEFNAAKTASDLSNRFFTITALTDNTSSTDREAYVDIHWGTITLKVQVNQMSPVTRLDGIQVIPSEMNMIKAGETKEICVSLSGNYAGITRADIDYTVLYGTGTPGWLQVGPGVKADDPSKGLFYYTVTASALNGATRSAGVRFIVEKGSGLSAATLTVNQSSYEPGGTIVRELSVTIWELNTDKKTYTSLGSLTDYYQKIQGLPAGQQGTNHLHFQIVEYKQLKYILSIRSSMPWKIVTPGNAGVGLYFSMRSHTGDPGVPQLVEVMAVDNQANGWSGSFYIEYEDGERVNYYVHQHGVFKILTSDNLMYYYGTFMMNGKLWLDRNIGATVGMDPNDPQIGYFTNQTGTGITSTAEAKGVYVSNTQLPNACPTGFRPPRIAAGCGELDWLFGSVTPEGALTWSGMNGNEAAGGVSFKNVWYVTISDEPLQRFFLPVCGYAYYNNNTTGRNEPSASYWVYNNAAGTSLGYISIYAVNSNKQHIDTPQAAYYSFSLRCVRGDD